MNAIRVAAYPLAALMSVGLLSACSERPHDPVQVQTNVTIDTPDGPVNIGPSPSAAPSTHVGLVEVPERPDVQSIDFIKMMLLFNEITSDMCDTVTANPQASQRLLDLAAGIEAADDASVNEMRLWLKQWGEPVPDLSLLDERMPMTHGDDPTDLTHLHEFGGATLDREFSHQMRARFAIAQQMAERVLNVSPDVHTQHIAQDILTAIADGYVNLDAFDKSVEADPS